MELRLTQFVVKKSGLACHFDVVTSTVKEQEFLAHAQDFKQPTYLGQDILVVQKAKQKPGERVKEIDAITQVSPPVLLRLFEAIRYDRPCSLSPAQALPEVFGEAGLHHPLPAPQGPR